MLKILIWIVVALIICFSFYYFTETGKTYVQNLYALWIAMLEFFGYGAQEIKSDLIIATTFLPSRE